MIGDVDVDGTEMPTAFRAVTENVYGLPRVSPVKMHSSGAAVRTHVAPELAVTTYSRTGKPPSFSGGSHVTRTAPWVVPVPVFKATPVTVRGAVGGRGS